MEMIDDKAGGLADLMCIEDKTGSSNLDQDWQLQGALNKRRYQDMELANTSNAAPEKRSRSTRGVKLEEATKDSDALHRVLKYVSTTLARLHSWKHDILKHVPISKMNPDHQWLDKDLDYFFSQVTHLFEQVLYQLRSPGRDDVLSKTKFEESVKKSLVIVLDAPTLPSMDLITNWPDAGWRVSLRHHCYHFKMMMLSDLKKYHILPESLISEYLNKETQGRLIWKYLNSILLHSNYKVSFSPYLLYPNGDLKLSLQTDPSTEKFNNVFHRQSTV
ncbi:hypothetical protein PCANC_01435 [Puccinia coronata f. sp. avenae]|uniref:Uncharacterized protein n=1 Tax=Puccinia coronata f. sp. avenae TaxID=200324 RepID=A0A2N5W2Z7_9BASI|nr:hypothetical protein PCANC_01435 [Puccinia coronata f. sp. avenae]